jgi:putative Mg2+ transporter-C (MgtC) family protein
MLEITPEYQLEVFDRLCYAIVLGAAVGLEREYRGHEAGIRSLSLVCLGATGFGEVSVLFGDSRVAANVVQGVGFLGAGLIFQRRDHVKGITTAATLWVMAGLGLMVSVDLWLTAGLLTVLLIVLLELQPLSDRVFRYGRRHERQDGPGEKNTGPPAGSV